MGEIGTVYNFRGAHLLICPDDISYGGKSFLTLTVK